MVTTLVLCRAVEVVCREGPKLVLELARFGAEFTRSEAGELHLTREGGHSARRIVHAGEADNVWLGKLTRSQWSDPRMYE